MKKILLFMLCIASSVSAAERNSYQPTDFSNLLGMKGFSDQMLKMHFQLYQGYVKNTNEVGKKIDEMKSKGEERTPAFAGYKRMYGWEFNGMRLHELYFGNLGGDGKIVDHSPLIKKMIEEYGSFENWKQDFIATGLIRGIGWSVLYLDQNSGRLTNAWINEHDLGHLSGNQPLLIMDVFEHAYMPDYGLNRSEYIQAFFNNINWGVVNARYSPH